MKNIYMYIWLNARYDRGKVWMSDRRPIGPLYRYHQLLVSWIHLNTEDVSCKLILKILLYIIVYISNLLFDEVGSPLTMSSKKKIAKPNVDFFHLRPALLKECDVM